MTPDQIALVQQSFAAATASAPKGDLALAEQFYDRLFASAPEVRSLFSTDPAEQRRKFTDELDTIVWSIANLDDFLETTMALGARHLAYGTTIAHYRVVGESLIGALGDQLGSDFTPEVAEAWRAAYDLVAEAMMMGADHPAAGSPPG